MSSPPLPSRSLGPAVVVCKWQREFIATVLDCGARLYVVLDDGDVAHRNPDWDLLARAEHVYRVSGFDSIEELGAVAADLTVRGAEIDQVISQSEYSQYGAGYLRTLLCPGRTDPLAHVAYRDKRLMKSRVNAAGITSAPWVSLADPAATGAAAEVAGRLAFPVVVKPAAGLGTMSTFRVADPDELTRALGSWRSESALIGRQLIAEEFVTGRELHVDALWRNGKPLFLTVSGYAQPRLDTLSRRSLPDAPSDGSQLIPESEDPELHGRVRDLHGRINEALGIVDEVTHLELFQRADGELVFSEIATRAAGAWVPSMLGAHLGGDFWEIIATGLISGTLPPLDPGPPFVGGAHIAPGASGRITSMPTDDELAAFPGIISWDRWKNVGDDFTDRHGADWCLFVVYGAQDPHEFAAQAARIATGVRVEVTAEP